VQLKVGVIGYGHWGPNLVQTFTECASTELISVCDLDESKLNRAKLRFPTLAVTTDFHKLIHHPDINLIAVATPVGSHYELALAALHAGKHVLIEKPMTETVAQAEHLVQVAEEKGLKIAVDHVVIFSPAVQKIKAFIDAGELGALHYYDSFRANLGLFQKDVDVAWDLAVHDLAVLDYLLNESPEKVHCERKSHYEGQPADMAFITLRYPSGFIAHLNVSWISPIKSRRIIIGGSQKMVVYDDLEDTAKIKLFDKSIKLQKTVNGSELNYHVGDQIIPHLPSQAPLRAQIDQIVDCLLKGTPLISDARMGLRMVRILNSLSQG
jgi:predicted dehydrogenase